MIVPLGSKVYVSGPYAGDVAWNVTRAMRAGGRLLDAGYFPYVPHLNHFLQILAAPRPREIWMAVDLAFLPCCDVVLRLDASPGADEEKERANELGIAVYTEQEFWEE